MAAENAVRTLSNDELDTVSGGVDCVRDAGFKFFGVSFGFYSCDDGSFFAGTAGTPPPPSLGHEPVHVPGPRPA